MTQVYKDKIINTLEQSPISLRDGALIIKTTVTRIDSLKPSSLTYGFLVEDTLFKAMPAEKDRLKIKVTGAESDKKQLFKADFNFSSLGIGGLDKEFSEIFRRAFNSRRFSQSVIKKYGMSHCKGMILYGPPGTGKTLIARKIAKVLNCTEPKVVNGPEIFDKFVGGSEENIRKLFADAESD
jgi:vesicle-fusing ATPase